MADPFAQSRREPQGRDCGRMGGSNAIGELRLPASDVSAGEPRHRAVRDEDPWFDPRVAPRDYRDPSGSERGPLYRGTLGGITNWPDDSLTLPGVALAPAFAGPVAEVPGGVVPAIRERAASIAEAPAPAPAPESSEDSGNAGMSDGPSAPGTEERAHHRVTLSHRISAVLGTTRGKWAVAAIGATIALIALGVVLAVHSHRTPAAAVEQATPAVSYPAPYPSATPSDPLRDTTTGLPSDPRAGASNPFTAGGARPPAMSPYDTLPADPPSDDPLTPSAEMPLDPEPSDPQLDQMQPVGPDQTQDIPTQGQAGLSHPQSRPDDRATTPRNSSPLTNSLGSITAPKPQDNSDRGESDSQGRRKPVGGDLSGLGRGL